MPGFAEGLVFWALLRGREGRRRVDGVSLARAGLWGLATGLVLGVVAAAVGVGSPQPRAVALMITVAAALGVVAGVGSVLFLRRFLRLLHRPAASRIGAS